MKLHIHCCFCFAVLLIAVAKPVWVLGQVTTATELFQIYSDQLESFSRVSFCASFTDYIAPDEDATNTLQMKWKVDFNQKWYLKEIIDNDAKNNNSSISSLTNDRVLSVSVYPDSDSGELQIGITSYVEIPKDYWRQSIRMLYFSWPFGYFANGTDDLSILELIRNVPKKLLHKDNRMVLVCQSNDFDFELWFDPEKDYAVEKILIKRLAAPNSPFHFVTAKYFVDKFEQINDKWFPIKYSVECAYPGGTLQLRKQDGLEFGSNDTIQKEPRTLVASVVFSKVEFPEKFISNDFKISMVIANGTPVYMQDAFQIDYVWMDGKPVVKTDEVALRIARGDYGFMPGPKNPRFWFMVLGLGLLLLGGGLKIRSMLKVA